MKDGGHTVCCTNAYTGLYVVTVIARVLVSTRVCMGSVKCGTTVYIIESSPLNMGTAGCSLPCFNLGLCLFELFLMGCQLFKSVALLLSLLSTVGMKSTMKLLLAPIEC